jgi:hypothetical protein
MAKSIGGTKGFVTLTGAGPIDGTDIHIFAWTANYRKDVFPDDKYQDSGNWKTKRGGMADLAGTFTGRAIIDSSNNGLFPNGGLAMATENETPAAVMNLGLYTGTSLDFTGIITNMAFQHARTGADVIITATFESSGAVTETEPT